MPSKLGFFGFLLPLLVGASSSSGCGAKGSDSEPTATMPEPASTSGATTPTSPTSAATVPTTTASTTTDTDAATTGEATGCTASPQALADCVDAAAYTADLTEIAKPRAPGSAHWQAVQKLCADRLDGLGYAVELHNYGTGVNVIGRRAGTTLASEAVVVAAHYDHIPGCNGADDNATGVAATLEIARVLAQANFERSLVVACWDEEEDGLIGAKAWVAGAVAANTQVVLNLNFDMIGFSNSTDNSQQVPAGFDLAFPQATEWLMGNNYRGDFIAIVASAKTHTQALHFAAASDRIGLRQVVIELPAGAESSPLFDDLRRSDHAPFWDAGFPALFLTDTADFRNRNYHCASGPDDIATLDLEFAVAVTRATVETAATALVLSP